MIIFYLADSAIFYFYFCKNIDIYYKHRDARGYKFHARVIMM